MSRHMRERPSTVDTRSPGIAFRRSIRRPAAWLLPFQHPTAAPLEWPGRKGVSGLDSIATARPIRSIRIPARSFAPSSRTASSPASPGWKVSYGTAPGKPRKANTQNRSAVRRGSGADRHAARCGRVGRRVRRQRHVLLRRRKQRESKSHSAAKAKLSLRFSQARLRAKSRNANVDLWCPPWVKSGHFV
jgi:hypothetical protein